jgi:hypothetical protein
MAREPKMIYLKVLGLRLFGTQSNRFQASPVLQSPVQHQLPHPPRVFPCNRHGRSNDGEGTEDDLSEGTGFEAVRNPVKSLSSIAGPPIPSAAPTPSSATRIPLQPSPGPSRAGTAHSSSPSNSIISFVKDVDSYPATITCLSSADGWYCPHLQSAPGKTPPKDHSLR